MAVKEPAATRSRDEVRDNEQHTSEVCTGWVARRKGVGGTRDSKNDDENREDSPRSPGLHMNYTNWTRVGLVRSAEINYIKKKKILDGLMKVVKLRILRTGA